MPIWQWYRFSDMSPHVLYAIMQARQAVFVVEQDCIYHDLDDIDQNAWHVCAWQQAEQGEQKQANLLAYLRVVPPGVNYEEPSLGRVLSTEQARGTGVGRALVAEGLAFVSRQYPGQAVRISAQQYLQAFYESFGFVAVSEVYLEDDIPHIEMLKESAPC